MELNRYFIVNVGGLQTNNNAFLVRKEDDSNYGIRLLLGVDKNFLFSDDDLIKFIQSEFYTRLKYRNLEFIKGNSGINNHYFFDVTAENSNHYFTIDIVAD